MASETDLLTPLRRYWGYSSFRPLQERVVRSLLAGRDTCVVMPTGGGKSLCYQLPALVSGRTAVVISPLIALMQDQAAQLAQMGIPAAVLNSSITDEQQAEVMREARGGAYRLLYLAPERLARGDTLGWLRHVPIAFFAIDEAHCISEWGHEFRPEYRQLSLLRTQFPDRPIAAFTASATRHVRHDILAQLQLRDPDKYIASFHRPNLRYLVRECDGYEQSALLLRALENYLQSHEEGNVIVYAPTINRVEETVDFLEDQGIPAVAYHAKMENTDRRRNQERWMSDEVRVLVGTIAFGLGINKAAVRAVIHLALPKSIEQYYQEAGRAGRDGQPSDCVLLWQKKDAGLLGFFANKILDAAERDRAWQRYHKIRAFVDSARCRHLQICAHFGETPTWKSCDACDVCVSAPEWLSAPVDSVRTKTRRFTKETGLPAAAKTASTASVAVGMPLGIDAELREYMREWRRSVAREQNVSAFVVLHDTTLEEICRLRPVSIAQLRGITGIGERKAEKYGKEIVAALQRYRQGARASAQAEKEKKAAPAEETLRLLAEGKSFEEIAKIRERQLSTIVNAVAALVERGELEFQPAWIDPSRQSVIEAACAQLGMEHLKSLKDSLPPEITYEEIRLVVARRRREERKKATIPA